MNLATPNLTHETRVLEEPEMFYQSYWPTYKFSILFLTSSKLVTLIVNFNSQSQPLGLEEEEEVFLFLSTYINTWSHTHSHTHSMCLLFLSFFFFFLSFTWSRSSLRSLCGGVISRTWVDGTTGTRERSTSCMWSCEVRETSDHICVKCKNAAECVIKWKSVLFKEKKRINTNQR